MGEDEEAIAEQPVLTVGGRLRAARMAAGLGREDIAASTKIAERHLIAIEEDRFSDLAGRTYAIGFARAYARAVGADEGEIADAVRRKLDLDEQQNPNVMPEAFEPGDPARVPSARLAWSAAIGGVVAVIVLLMVFWPSFLSPGGSLPSLLGDEPEASETDPGSVPPAPGAKGNTVVFTATEPQVWVKFYDAAGNQLFQKEMGEGERYALPGDVDGPLLWTARPDALAITVGGKAVARLSDKPETVKDVPVSAAALLERNNPSGSQPATQSRTITRSAPPPPPAAAPLPSAPRAAPVLPQARPAPVAERPSAPASEAVSTVSEPDSTVSE